MFSRLRGNGTGLPSGKSQLQTVDQTPPYWSRRCSFPPIVFVNTKELLYWRENTGHAMVVVGFDEDLIYLNDPAFADAPQIIPVSEFDLAWLELDQFYVIIEKK